MIKRPYGLGAYGWGPYGTWRFPMFDTVMLEGLSGVYGTLTLPRLVEIYAAMGSQSSLWPRLAAELHLHAGMAGMSGMTPKARLYWEIEDPCPADWEDDTPPCEPVWVTVPPCDSVWQPAATCVPAWTASASCDTAWVVRPPPPLTCPEIAANG